MPYSSTYLPRSEILGFAREFKRFKLKSSRKITHIVWHTSASFNVRAGVLHPTAAEIGRWHKARGWSGIGYHFVVRPSGIEPGRNLDLAGAHVAGFNATTVGICVTGHGDVEPFETYQSKAAIVLTAMLIVQNGLDDEFLLNNMRLIGHREVGKFRKALEWMVRNALSLAKGVHIPDPRKSCPGSLIDMARYRQEVALAVTVLRNPE